MSFSSFKETIDEGDTVILYLSPTNLHAIEVRQTILNKNGVSVENVFQTIYGALNVKLLIGKKFGAKVELSRGWAYVLHPTPELWTITLPHRTQIIYTPDISMILFQLELRPGCVVIESGTGSGSLTHALARCVRPKGHVFTYDFHEQRALIAQKEFERHGLEDVITVEHRDVCQFGFNSNCGGKADAVFLDLPHPWSVVPFAVSSLKTTGGRICSFSPCIEQVQRTCSALDENGFQEITTMECLQKEYAVQTRTYPVIPYDKDDGKKEFKSVVTTAAKQTLPGHTGYLTFATLPPIWARPKPRKITSEIENIDMDSKNDYQEINESVSDNVTTNDADNFKVVQNS